MIRAIISDFNGAIADVETPHLHCVQQALAEHGQSNLEGKSPESIEPLVSANRPAEPSGQVPRR
jgi:phosphoglycolate phosphatase-like HAD superfamily hydrolase